MSQLPLLKNQLVIAATTPPLCYKKLPVLPTGKTVSYFWVGYSKTTECHHPLPQLQHLFYRYPAVAGQGWGQATALTHLATGKVQQPKPCHIPPSNPTVLKLLATSLQGNKFVWLCCSFRKVYGGRNLPPRHQRQLTYFQLRSPP